MTSIIKSNEDHLKDFMKHCDLLTDLLYQNEVVIGKLNDTLNVKISLDGGIEADRRNGLSVEIINKTTGKVDALVFRFANVWGKCKLSNGNTSAYYLWRYRGDPFDWYSGAPSLAQKKQFMERVCQYIALFK